MGRVPSVDSSNDLMSHFDRLGYVGSHSAWSSEQNETRSLDEYGDWVFFGSDEYDGSRFLLEALEASQGRLFP